MQFYFICIDSLYPIHAHTVFELDLNTLSRCFSNQTFFAASTLLRLPVFLKLQPLMDIFSTVLQYNDLYAVISLITIMPFVVFVRLDICCSCYSSTLASDRIGTYPCTHAYQFVLKQIKGNQ